MNRPQLNRLTLALLFVALAFSVYAGHCNAQSFQYPPYGSHRGHMVARAGHGHVVKYRWGNGLTPTGGAVLVGAFDAFAPVIGGFLGGSRDAGLDEDARSRDMARETDWSQYAEQQARASDLLARTAGLVDSKFAVDGPEAGGGKPGQLPIPPQTPQPSFGQRPSDAELKTKYGDNPWTKP